MNVRVFDNKLSLAQAAAEQAGAILRDRIRNQGTARIVAATGASQFEFLEELTKAPDIDWKRVEMFHLDEYIGLPVTHPASFRKYLLDRLITRVGITRHHLLDGEQPPQTVANQVTTEIRKGQIDVAFVGIGENGHLAFNDPPADFETDEAYIVVELDEACRRQQLGEGWFQSLEDVPRRALSMTVKQILKSREVIGIVPDARKAHAVAKCFQGEISPQAPASVLRTHANATIYLDRESASMLRPETIAAYSAKQAAVTPRYIR